MYRVTLVTGQAQQGKTTLALALARKEAARLLILDPIRSKPFRPVVTTWRNWPELRSFLEGREARGRWEGKLSSQNFPDYTEALAHAPFYRHVTILVDEGMLFAGDLEAGEYLINASRMNAHYGGGLGVPLIITAQRPNDLPRDVRSQVDRWFSFRQEEPGDLKYLAERCNPDFAAKVAGLPPHQWLQFPPSKAVAGEEADGHARQGVSLGDGRGAGHPRSPADVPEDQPDPSPSGDPEVTGSRSTGRE